MSTFVSLGNAHQPFRRLLDEVARIAPQLPQPVLVQYGHTVFDSPACQTTAFMDMEVFVQHVQQAELLILHAGAGSVIHAVQAGKVPVVMPRRVALGEHVNDHQLQFARMLAENKKIVLAEDPSSLLVAAQEALRRQRSGTAESAVPAEGSHMLKLVSDAIQAHARK